LTTAFAGEKEVALPLPPEPVPPVPTVRLIKLSTAAAALLLSLTAPPLTSWMRARCFWVVGDCRMRSVRDGGGALEDEDEDEVFGLGVGAAVDGVELAMYKFEAVVIALESRVVVPEMALLINKNSECQ
jgi:hypothetical protein